MGDDVPALAGLQVHHQSLQLIRSRQHLLRVLDPLFRLPQVSDSKQHDGKRGADHDQEQGAREEHGAANRAHVGSRCVSSRTSALQG